MIQTTKSSKEKGKLSTSEIKAIDATVLRDNCVYKAWEKGRSKDYVGKLSSLEAFWCFHVCVYARGAAALAAT